MKILRYKNEQGNVGYGILDNNYIIPIIGTPFGDEIQLSKEERIPTNNCTLLKPCLPTKVIALAINYQGATGQTKNMSEPLVFLKASNCAIGCDDKVKIAFPS